MSRFEFIMMIASVVVAIGMTEIAGGWGKMVRSPAVIKFDWLHFSWTVYILLLAVQYWVGMWSYQQLDIAYVGQIYSLVIPTIFMVIAAYAITPDIPLQGKFVSRDYYMANRRGVFLPLGLFALASWGADIAIAGVDRLEVSFMAMSVVVAVAMVLLTLTQKLWVHVVVLVIAGAIVVGGLFSEMADLDTRWLRP